MTIHDHFTSDGARLLAKKIERYWADRGHRVAVAVETAPFTSCMRQQYCVVRSDLVNGLPAIMAKRSRRPVSTPAAPR